MGAPDVLQIKDIDTRANFCKNDFYLATIKNNNGAVAMKKILYNVNRTNNSINYKKYNIGGYKIF